MTLLNDIPWMKKIHVTKLQSLGYKSVERLVAVAAIRESAVGIRKVLDLSEQALDTLISRLTREHLPENAVMTPPAMPGNLLGCTVASLLDEKGKYPVSAGRPWLDQMKKHGGIPDRVVLIRDDEKIFDQGQRGTCVANAFVKVLEYEYRHQKRKDKEFSRQWLYYQCKESDGIPDQSGTYMQTAVDVLTEKGCCEERLWPYNPDIGDTEGQGPAPEGACRQAINHKVLGVSGISLDTGPEEVCAALAYGAGKGGFMLAGSLLVYPSSQNAQTYRDGFWPEPLPGEAPRGGHAVTFAGYQLDPFAPGGGWFYCINSWGEHYAAENEIHSGCFRVSFQYMNNHGRTYFYVLQVSKNWSKKLLPELKLSELSVPNVGIPIGINSKKTHVLGGLLGCILWLICLGMSHDTDKKMNVNVDRADEVTEVEGEGASPVQKRMYSWVVYWDKLVELLTHLQG